MSKVYHITLPYLVFAASGLRGDNDVSRVKRGRLNKNFWETLD